MKTFLCTLIFIHISIFLQAQNPEVVITTGHSQLITFLAISPDSKIIASTSADHLIKFWDVNSGKEITTMNNKNYSEEGEQRISGFKFSPDSRNILINDEAGHLKLWNIEKEQTLFSFKSVNMIKNLCADIAPNKIAYCNENWNISVFNTQTKQELIIPEYRVRALKFIQANTNLIVFMSFENKMIVYDLVKKSVIREIQISEKPLIFFEVSFNGEFILIGSNSNEIELYSLKTGELMNKKTFNNTLLSYKFHPKTNDIITLTNDFVNNKLNISLTIWDKLKFTEKQKKDIGITITNIMDVDVTGNYAIFNSSTIIGYSNVYTISIFDLELSKVVKLIYSRSHNILQVAMAKNTPNIASVDNDLYLRFWNLEKLSLDKSILQIQNASLEPSGKYLLTMGTLMSNNYLNGLHIWDLDSLNLHTSVKTSQVLFSDIKLLSNKQNCITSEMYGNISIWDIKQKKEIKKFNLNYVGMQNIAITPDLKYIASGISGIGGIKIINTTNNQIIPVQDAHPVLGASNLKFSSDGKYLLTGSFDNTIKLWETGTWKLIKDYKGNIGPVSSVSFNFDNSLVASASRGSTVVKVDYAVNVWETESGKQVCNFLGHVKNVNSVAFFGKKRLLISGSDDGRIKVWNIDSCKEIVSCIPIDKDDFIFITPDYYYTGTKDALKGVGFKMNGVTLYPFEQFDLRLNRPDIIAERIGLASKQMIDALRKAYQKRLLKMGFNQQMLNNDFNLPKIEIKNKDKIPFIVASDMIELNIEAIDEKYLLDRINIWINDVPLYGSDGLNLRNKNSHKTAMPVKLKLSKGNNKIQVSVLNQKGAESLKETVFTTCNLTTVKPNLYVVVVGVSKYHDSIYNLQYAAKDANDVASIFESKKENYNKINIIKLIDKEATKNAILKVKETLMKTEVDDQVIVFLAGHGLITSDYEYYFATHDIVFNEPDKNGLLYDELEKLLDGIPARKKLLMIDACHSGELDVETAESNNEVSNEEQFVVTRSFNRGNLGNLTVSNSFELMKVLFADLRRGSGAVVISSAGGAEYAFESPKFQNGVFTYVLLDALKTKSADSNKDGIITVSELRDYVIGKVHKLTKGKQTPTARRENLDTDFVIW